MVAQPELDPRGLKRICASCGNRFYDLNKRPIVCPSCETEFTGEIKVKSRRGRTANDAADSQVKGKTTNDDEDDDTPIMEDDDEDDTISLDDLDEDDDSDDDDIDLDMDDDLGDLDDLEPDADDMDDFDEGDDSDDDDDK